MIGRSLLVAVGAAAFASSAALAADSLAEALKDSEVLLDWRLRHESVEQAGFAHDANALTSRLRAGFRTAPLAGTSLLAEVVGIASLRDDYNSTTNGNVELPIVADPSDFVAINQLAIVNTSLEKMTWTIGRQRIIRDNARFVGNVGWRQNEQTYDAIRVQYGGGVLAAELTYADQVNRIFGPDSLAGEWSGDILLATLSYPLTWGRLTGFNYVLELDQAPALSTRTTGLRLTGSKPAGDVTATYALAVARQSDAGMNPERFDEGYYFVEAGMELTEFGAALGYEQLGSNGTSAVTTPLATLHAFQGWADKFSTTPDGGIEDLFLRLSYAFGAPGPFQSLSVVAVYHDFGADYGSADYGAETDLSLVASIDQLALTLKYASYDADALLTNTDKTWLALDYSF